MLFAIAFAPFGIAYCGLCLALWWLGWGPEWSAYYE